MSKTTRVCEMAYLDAPAFARLKALAASRGKPRSVLIREAIDDLLARHDGHVRGVSKGELHEATRGFIAMIRKASLSMDGGRGDARKSRDQRTVAFAHFKKLVSTSNLPALMNLTPDEIIDLVRTI
jgi:predicted transcriptional regulator